MPCVNFYVAMSLFVMDFTNPQSDRGFLLQGYCKKRLIDTTWQLAVALGVLPLAIFLMIMLYSSSVKSLWRSIVITDF